MKKYFTLLGVLFVLMTVTVTSPVIAEIDATPLALDTEATASITTGGQTAYFSFTPSERGLYIFSSSGSSDTYGFLYDTDMNEIVHDDDSGDSSNFRISYSLSAGTQYYYGAKFFSGSQTGSFQVLLRKSNITTEIKEDADGVRTLEVSGQGPISTEIDSDCDVKRIVVKEGITSICDYAFGSFYQVSEVILPASCVSIGNHAFNSYNLRALTLAEGLQSIGERAFGYDIHAYCVAVIPDSVTDIGDGALDCLIPAVYPGSAAEQYCIDNEITDYILVNRSGDNTHRMALLKAVGQVEDVPLRYRGKAVSILNSMSLTDSQCDTLRDYVLEEEKKLKNAMFDNNMTTGEILSFIQRFISMMDRIGVTIQYEISLFNEYPGVKLTATVNGEDTKIDIYRNGGAWYVRNVTPAEANGYSYLEGEEGITITGYSGSETVLSIPSQINRMPVVGIASLEAYYHCGFPDTITSITIPNSVTIIGNGAFAGCSGLTGITIPSSVTRIGDRAFSECAGLTAVTIPESVTAIGDSAFSGCSGLTRITIPDGITHIDYAFTDCTSLATITIPGSVTSINGAFSRCTSLTAVTISNGVKKMDYAFTGCTGLTTVTLPNSVEELNGTFSGCTSLTTITIPGSVTSIGYYAFNNCSGLTSVIIPSSVTYIDYSAFGSCSNLRDVYYSGTEEDWNAIEIEDNNTALTDAAIHFRPVPDLVLPDQLTVIESKAFNGIAEGVIVYVPGTVTEIADDAFDSGVIITTPAGSFAATWAKKNNITCYEQEE